MMVTRVAVVYLVSSCAAHLRSPLPEHERPRTANSCGTPVTRAARAAAREDILRTQLSPRRRPGGELRSRGLAEIHNASQALVSARHGMGVG